MQRLFGTDGVRGLANSEVTPELAMELGRAAACYFSGLSGGKPEIFIGRDTRLSGYMLEAALAAGISSAGGQAHILGVMPTPAVAYLTANSDACAGVVISASHNTFEDNGIKFFSSEGVKLPDAVEDKIEALIKEKDASARPAGRDLGLIAPKPGLAADYIKHVTDSAGVSLNGLKAVLDCANGAAYELAPIVLRRLGAEVITIFDRPDGVNINDKCGSTHLEALAAAVLENKADVGIAHDGDADRCLMVDENGDNVDGDQMMLISALELMKKNRLKDKVLVTTVMSNIGLHAAMREYGGRCVVTPVGDRYVLEEMLKNGYSLGGEQSGHIIFAEYATTGDGLVTATQVLKAMVKNNRRMSELAALMVRYPQVLTNVRVLDKTGWETNDAIKQAIEQAAGILGDNGRILVRASGTEPLIRVMAEGPDQEKLNELTACVADVIKSEMVGKGTDKCAV